MSHIATEEDLEFEWKLNYEFLSAVQSQLSDYEVRPDMEEIESILISAGIYTTPPAGYNQYEDLVSLQALNNAHDGSTEVHDAIANMIAKADLPATQGKEWISVDVRLPENCVPVQVNIVNTYRYNHYKPQSQQYKRGIKGRWQKFNGWGWDNCDAPNQWKPQPPQGESK